MSAKEEILELMEGLPDAPTYADAFDRLRQLYNREVAPIIAQYGRPPSPPGHWRRDITGPAEAVEQKRVITTRSELLQLMQELPDEADVEDTIAEAMDRLYLLYRVARGTVRGQGHPPRGSQATLGQMAQVNLPTHSK